VLSLCGTNKHLKDSVFTPLSQLFICPHIKNLFTILKCLSNGDKFDSSVRVAKDVKIQLDCFNGTKYTRWMDKMMFLLYLKYTIFLTQICVHNLNHKKMNLLLLKLKREEDEVFCLGHVLNTLTNRLYDNFSKLKLPNEI